MLFENGLQGPYSFEQDACGGYRCYKNKAVSSSCYKAEECADVCGEGICVNIPKQQEICGGEDTFCIDSCELNDKCYAYGYVKDGMYCSEESDIFMPQAGNGEYCTQNFECKDNLCIDNNCIDQGIFKKFLNWLGTLFGGKDKPDRPSANEYKFTWEKGKLQAIKGDAKPHTANCDEVKIFFEHVEAKLKEIEDNEQSVEMKGREKAKWEQRYAAVHSWAYGENGPCAESTAPTGPSGASGGGNDEGQSSGGECCGSSDCVGKRERKCTAEACTWLEGADGCGACCGSPECEQLEGLWPCKNELELGCTWKPTAASCGGGGMTLAGIDPVLRSAGAEAGIIAVGGEEGDDKTEDEGVSTSDCPDSTYGNDIRGLKGNFMGTFSRDGPTATQCEGISNAISCETCWTKKGRACFARLFTDFCGDPTLWTS
jgi:hypothetical protein